jgi:hypothetical protein
MHPPMVRTMLASMIAGVSLREIVRPLVAAKS